MRLLVTHDQHGTIVAIGVPSEHQEGVGIRPKSGHRVSVIEVPQVEHPGHFTRCLSEFRVDTGSGKPGLIKK